jgi:hypothetical protein
MTPSVLGHLGSGMVGVIGGMPRTAATERDLGDSDAVRVLEAYGDGRVSRADNDDGDRRMLTRALDDGRLVHRA